LGVTFLYVKGKQVPINWFLGLDSDLSAVIWEIQKRFIFSVSDPNPHGSAVDFCLLDPGAGEQKLSAKIEII
jgi:hypothetical protein